MYEIPDQMLVSRKQAVMAPEVLQHQTAVHQAVGRLIAIWANVESTMLHLVARLLRSSDENAVATYLSFGAMRARENFMFALAENSLEEPLRSECRSLIGRFKKLSEPRNELVHAEYVMDTTTYAYLETCHLRLDPKTNKVEPKRKPLNQSRINAIRLAGDQLMDLGHEILALCRKLDQKA